MRVSFSLVSAVLIQLLCQLFKVVYYSFKERRLQIHRFFSAGGMPSAHTAFVASLTVSIGLNSGLGSEVFAVAFVFSVITVYDILRVRAAVQRHSEILAVLIADREAVGEGGRDRARLRLPPAIGHTPAEVGVGAVVGALAAAVTQLAFVR
jgi:acid phosphatase family membrane protein YuiD